MIGGGIQAKAALGVANLLPLSPVGTLRVPDATQVDALPAMVLPAAEGAAQILTAGVAGMGQKPNSAVATAHDATAQIAIAFVSQGRVERDLIVTDQWTGTLVLVPIPRKTENLFEGYGKKAKLSVTMQSS